jgi:hypothetical protein
VSGGKRGVTAPQEGTRRATALVAAWTSRVALSACGPRPRSPPPFPTLRPSSRERELAAVKVAPGDIDLLAAEAEVDKKQAERRLRECGGSLVEALKSYL